MLSCCLLQSEFLPPPQCEAFNSYRQKMGVGGRADEAIYTKSFQTAGWTLIVYHKINAVHHHKHLGKIIVSKLEDKISDVAFRMVLFF